MSDDESPRDQHSDSFLSMSGRFISSSDPIEPEILFPLPTLRTQSETDIICTVCSRNFGIKGIANTMKLTCNFCYRGVCSQCMSNFYYFHSESKNYEKMCPNCHHKLTMMTEEFSQEIKNCRLERIQLRQEIDLALQQKVSIAKERVVVEEKLNEIKGNLELSAADKHTLLKDLSDNNNDLKDKAAEMHHKSEDAGFNLKLIKERHASLKKNFEEFKKKAEKDASMVSKLKDEINAISAKKAVLVNKRGNDTVEEENTLGKIEGLSEVIALLQERVNKKNEKNRNLEKLIKEIEDRKEENNVKIAIMQEKFEEQKGSERRISEVMTEDEEIKINQLRKDLEKHDELIETMTERLRMLQAQKSSNSSTISIESDLPERKKSKKSESRGGDSCCSNCTLV